MSNNALILVGKIVAAHGIKGWVKLRSFTADPANIFNYQLFFKDQDKPIKLKKQGVAKELFLASLSISHNRNDAEKIVGWELYMASSQLKALDNDEFYYRDLIGLNLITPDQQIYGEVIAMHNFGAGDIMEVQLHNQKITEFIGFGKQNIQQVSIKEGYIVFVPDNKV